MGAGGDTYVQIRPQHQRIGSCTTANSTTIYLVQLRKHPEPKQQAIRLASRHESCRFSIDSRNDPGYRHRGHRRDVVLAGTWLNLSLEMSILSWPRSCVCLPTVIESCAWRRIVDVLERSHFGYIAFALHEAQLFCLAHLSGVFVALQLESTEATTCIPPSGPWRQFQHLSFSSEVLVVCLEINRETVCI